MSIIRRAENPADRFTMISNRWLRDTRIDMKAKGLLAFLQSNAVGWRTSITQIAAVYPDGRDSLRSGVKALVDAGYLVVERVRNPDGTMGGTEYIVVDPWSDRPETENPRTAEPRLGKPNTGNPTTKKTSTSEDQAKKTNVTSTSDVRSVAVDRQEAHGTEAQEPVSGADAPVDADEVERTVQHLPERLRPTTRDMNGLRDLVRQRMAVGWTRPEILDAVQQRLRPGAFRSATGLFADVLVPEGELPPSRRAAAVPEQARVMDIRPWCGQCHKPSRYPLDENGFVDKTQPPCSECEQLAFAAHMDQQAVPA